MKRFPYVCGLVLTLLPLTLSAQSVTWDTISTGCLRLVVGSNGEMGHNGIGKANMDYVAFGSDCDTAATVYLKSGGPFVIRHDGTTDSYTSALWDVMTRGFTSTSPLARFSAPGYTGLSTGVLLNLDSSVAVQIYFYAPTSGGDSCKFIIQESVFSAGPVTPPQSYYVLGEFLDWDVPSEVPASNTITRFSPKSLIFQQGTDISMTGCRSDTRRIASGFLLSYVGGGYDSCSGSVISGQFVSVAESLKTYDAISNVDAAKALWVQLQWGYHWEQSVTVLRDYVSSVQFAGGWNQSPATTVYSALITIDNGDTSDFRAIADAARKWHADHLRPGCPRMANICCLETSSDGRTGNVDCDPQKGIDISDLGRMIDYLFMQGEPLCCVGAADLIWDDTIDIADLTDLIDFLYFRFSPTAPCR